MSNNQSHKKFLLLDLTTYTELNTTERNAYSFYVSLMLKFNNNIILNTSNKCLSELTGIHRNSITKYINILLKLDYVYFKDNNLHINKFKKDKRLFKFSLYRSLDAEHVKELIEIEILRNEIKKQIFAIKFKTDFRANRNKMTNKRLKKNANLVHGDFNKDVLFSYRYASKKLNVSINKIQTLLKSASKNHLINTKYVYKFMCKIPTYKKFLHFKRILSINSDVFYNLRYDFKSNKVFRLIGTDIKFKVVLSLVSN